MLPLFVWMVINCLLVAMINAGEDVNFNVNVGGRFVDILSGEEFDLSGSVPVAARSSRVFRKV